MPANTIKLSYCYDEDAKQKQCRVREKFIRLVAQQLSEFEVKARFLAGGVAVWGEHWVKITRNGLPVVEAIVAEDYTIVRQWDGQSSGRNVSIPRDAEAFARTVRAEADKPFRRF